MLRIVKKKEYVLLRRTVRILSFRTNESASSPYTANDNIPIILLGNLLKNVRHLSANISSDI